MSSYQRNNIAFRISSADAISKFKAAQMHSFFQLVRKDIAFNDAAKEAVLLEFDRFSDWIFRTERICLSMTGSFSEQAITAINASIVQEFTTIETVVERYGDIFSSVVVKLSKIIHAYSISMLKMRMDKLIGVAVDDGFIKLVDSIGEYLQHFLVSMHELNNNIMSKKDIPFLSVANFCISADTKDDMSPCVRRAQFFLEHGAGNTFMLKNYSNADIFDEACEVLSTHGITLIPENIENLAST